MTNEINKKRLEAKRRKVRLANRDPEQCAARIRQYAEIVAARSQLIQLRPAPASLCIGKYDPKYCL